MARGLSNSAPYDSFLDRAARTRCLWASTPDIHHLCRVGRVETLPTKVPSLLASGGSPCVPMRLPARCQMRRADNLQLCQKLLLYLAGCGRSWEPPVPSAWPTIAAAAHSSASSPKIHRLAIDCRPTRAQHTGWSKQALLYAALAARMPRPARPSNSSRSCSSRGSYNG